MVVPIIFKMRGRIGDCGFVVVPAVEDLVVVRAFVVPTLSQSAREDGAPGCSGLVGNFGASGCGSHPFRKNAEWVGHPGFLVVRVVGSYVIHPPPRIYVVAGSRGRPTRPRSYELSSRRDRASLVSHYLVTIESFWQFLHEKSGA